MLRDHVLPAAVVGFLLLCGIMIVAMRPAPPEANAVHTSAVAVVELFTSDQCNTCEPADRLLSTLHRDAVRNGQPIYALDFHVDRPRPSSASDPYGQTAIADRQLRYAETLGDRVYTPQMVVNGQHAFVGSDDFHARRTIAEALRQQALLQLLTTATVRRQRDLEVNVDVTGRSQKAILNVAVVASEDDEEAHVVRSFDSRPMERNLTLNLPLPADVSPEAVTVIAYAQDAQTLAVLGATRARIER